MSRLFPVYSSAPSELLPLELCRNSVESEFQEDIEETRIGA